MSVNMQAVENSQARTLVEPQARCRAVIWVVVNCFGRLLALVGVSLIKGSPMASAHEDGIGRDASTGGLNDDEVSCNTP